MRPWLASWDGQRLIRTHVHPPPLANADASQAAAQQIGAIIVLTNSSYTIQGWHLALIDWAVTIFAIMCNTLLFRKLPLMFVYSYP